LLYHFVGLAPACQSVNISICLIDIKGFYFLWEFIWSDLLLGLSAVMAYMVKNMKKKNYGIILSEI
jgi:hypothetical protein